MPYILIAAFVAIGFAGHTYSDLTSRQVEPTFHYFVSPSGNDAASGLSASQPFRSIQHALDIARPGTTVTLAPGAYHETPTTKADGTKEQPIIIEGNDTAVGPADQHKTVLYGSGRIFNINNSHYRLQGFAINGQEELANTPYPTDPAAVNDFKDKYQQSIKDGRLIYVGSADTAMHLTDISIQNMYLTGGGGECVRFRNDTSEDTITNSVIRYCGLHAKKSSSDRYAYHNGEGIYIGTSPQSKSQPAHANDTSNHITVTDNIIDTYGSECVDIKENAHDNYVSHNTCRYNLEPVSYGGSNLEVRGDHNTITHNTISSSAGWNIKLASDANKYDKGGNVISANTLGEAAKNTNLYVGGHITGITYCGNKIDGSSAGIDKATVTNSCQ